MVLQDLSVGLLQVPNKQWGENVGGGGQTVSLPISFEVAFTAVVSADSSWCNASCHITTTTITTMNYQSNKPDIAQLGPVQWLAIGIQPQWGLGNPSINFPIAFPKECFIAAITRAAGNYEHSIVITTKNKTNLSWICKGYDNSAGNTYANWLALGCQLQWGYGNSESTQTFPIKFTNSVIGIYGSKRAINYEYTFAATSITNTNFFMSTRNSEGSSRVIACNWLAIGQQQTK